MNTSDDLTTSRFLNVALNRVPSLDVISDVRVLPTAGEQTINLVGISDGDRNDVGSLAKQLIHVTATSDAPNVVGNPTVVYDTANFAATGQIKFTPLALGTSTVTVNVTDAGWDNQFGTYDDRSLSRTFKINVVSVLNSWHNTLNRFDVDADGSVGPTDAIIVINAINRGEDGLLPPRTTSAPPFLDVDDDTFLSPLDVLIVINEINRMTSGGGEGEKSAAADIVAVRAAVDRVHASVGSSQLSSVSAGHSNDVWSDLGWLDRGGEMDSLLKKGRRAK